MHILEQRTRRRCGTVELARLPTRQSARRMMVPSLNPSMAALGGATDQCTTPTQANRRQLRLGPKALWMLRLPLDSSSPRLFFFATWQTNLTGRVGSARSCESVRVTCCPRSCLVSLHELRREGELGKEYAVPRRTPVHTARAYPPRNKNWTHWQSG